MTGSIVIIEIIHEVIFLSITDSKFSFLVPLLFTIFFFFFFFFKCLGFRCPFIFHQFIVNNYNFSKHCYYYYYILLQRNYMLQSLFFTVFLFVVRFSPVFCSVLRHLLVQSFSIVPSCPMPSPVQTSNS